MGTGTALLRALKKYGKGSFTKEIIADYTTRKEASDHEREVVTFDLINLKECYNNRTGGDNEFTPSEETKIKMRAAQGGANNPMYGKIGEKHHLFGKKHSEESKIKMKDSHTGVKLSEEHKKRLKGVNKGRKHSEEAKQKISAAKTGEKHHMFGKSLTDEHKQKIKASNTGIIKSDKTKELLRKNNVFCKPCKILGEVYISVREASRHLNISPSTIKVRLNSKSDNFKDWQYHNRNV
tara:strand:+ start:842 stop:1552 length:711 start_codon:yes stop_codon:yes gene_type:complete